MPVYKCGNGKYKIGMGPCMYTSKEKADRAYKAYKAKKHGGCTYKAMEARKHG